MPYPDASAVIDGFDRADGAPSAGAGSSLWTASSVAGAAAGCAISTNRLAGSAAGGNILGVPTFGPSLDIQFDFPVLCNANGSYIACWWGVQNPGASYTSYCLLLSRTTAANYQWQFRKYIGGARTTISTPSSSMAAGNRIGIRQSGTTIEFYRYTTSWAQVMSVVDTSIVAAKGPLAFEFGDTVARIDNLTGGTTAPLLNQQTMMV
jgi:hypothetical protein